MGILRHGIEHVLYITQRLGKSVSQVQIKTKHGHERLNRMLIQDTTQHATDRHLSVKR